VTYAHPKSQHKHHLQSADITDILSVDAASMHVLVCFGIPMSWNIHTGS